MFPHRFKIPLAMLFWAVLAFVPMSVVAAPPAQSDADIVSTAVAAGDFTTLVSAVEAAGLAETLQGDGPFTVFAPTDAAFDALPEGTVEALLQDPDGALRDILLFHVAAGEILAVDVLNSIDQSIEMANGQSAAIGVSGNRVLLETAGFVATDIQTSNGVIHVIDAVILPSTASGSEEPTDAAAATDSSAATAEASAPSASAESPDLVETAISADGFNTLVAAVQAAGLVETLQGDGPFTVFAPTDEAFAALPAGTLDQLLADPTGALKNVLLYHVVPGKVTAADVIALNNSAVTTALGQDFFVEVADGKIMINEATVVSADIETANGVIHVIDSVLVPSSNADAASVAASDAGCSTVYLVKSGDTLAKIAGRYGVGALALARANGIANPDLIYRGQRICISH